MKPQYRFDRRLNKSVPLINWKILAFTILLELVYVCYLQIMGLAFAPFIPFSSLSAPYRLQDLENLGVLIGNIYVTIAFGVTLGVIVGTIHGFGRIITFKIENLSQRHLGQIGLGLSI